MNKNGVDMNMCAEDIVCYEIQLDDAACPAFCSFTKHFHGTYQDIKKFMTALADHNEKGNHDMLLNAFQAWEEGDLEVEHSPAYHTCRLLTPERIVHRTGMQLKNVQWRHMNIWDFPHDFKADIAWVEQILVEQEKGGYIRCIRAAFENLMGRLPESPLPRLMEWSEVGDWFWGYPQMMAVRENYTYCRLFMEQQRYETLEEALRDMDDPEMINYSVICDEIMGDG